MATSAALATRPATSPAVQDMLAMGFVRHDVQGMLVDALGKPLPASNSREVEYFVPTTGATVATADSNMDGLAQINPAGTLANLQCNLPSDAKSVVGQEREFVFLKAITALTWNQIGNGATIYNAPTSAAIGGYVILMKAAANTWVAK